FRIRRHDGVYVWHQVRGNAVLDDNGMVREWVGICVDIDDRHRAAEQRENLHRSVEQALDLLVSVSAAASAALTTSPLPSASLERICLAQRWQFGQVWYPNKNGGLRCAADSVWNAEGFAAFRQASAQSAIEFGNDLPGRVADVRSATWFEDIGFADFPRLRS